MEIPVGAAAPVGCTSVWHNGKQYAITDGTYTGNTYIPSVPYPNYYPTMVDLNPVLLQIGSLASQLSLLMGEVANMKKDVEAMKKWVDAMAEELPSRLAEWSETLGHALDARFDDVDRALRLVLDE